VVANAASIDHYFWRAMSRVVRIEYAPCLIPIDEEYVVCPGSQLTIGFEDQPGLSLKWYDSEDKTNLVGTGYQITITKDNEVQQTWYVEVTDVGTGLVQPDLFLVQVTAGRCVEANDDYVSIFTSSTINVDVLANDSADECTADNILLTLDGSVAGQPKNGSATINGNKIEYTPQSNYSGSDSLRYIIDCNGVRDTATVYITILHDPSLILKDSCSTAPRLVVTPQSERASYIWYRSTDEGSTWDVIPMANSYEFLIIEAGYYKVTVSSGDVVVEILPVKVQIYKKVLLPGDRWWYQVRIE
jgi:hypothetical protein